MKNKWKDCVGCMASIKRAGCIGDYDDYVDVCPCRQCIVKMMCVDSCEEYKKLMYELPYIPGRGN